MSELVENQEVMKVLELLENGVITAEEAKELILIVR
ncbi:MAG: SHOCT-like domain-containing protein [Lachnospirales bacterium]